MSFYSDAPAELLYAMPAIGGAVTGTVTTGSAAGGPVLGGFYGSGTNPLAELPHNFFSKIGKSLLIEGGGVFTTGSTAGNMKFGVALDSATPGIATASIIASTGAFATIASQTGQFYFRVLVTATALGNSGTLQAFGILTFGGAVTTTVGNPSYIIGAGTTTPFTFNTVQTTPVWVEPFAYWSTTTTSPSMTMTNFFLWGLN